MSKFKISFLNLAVSVQVGIFVWEGIPQFCRELKEFNPWVVDLGLGSARKLL